MKQNLYEVVVGWSGAVPSEVPVKKLVRALSANHAVGIANGFSATLIKEDVGAEYESAKNAVYGSAEYRTWRKK